MTDDFIEEPILADDEDKETLNGPASKRKHDKLIDSIVHLGGKKRKVAIRAEPVGTPTDVLASTHTSSASKKIKGHQLLRNLNQTSSSQVQTLRKQLARINKHQAVLQEPLQKPQAEKAERIAAYNQESKSLSKWDSIVEKNRTAETLNFPLQNGGVQFQTTQEFVSKFKPLSSLERDIAAILQTSDNDIKSDSLLTQAEKKIISRMDLIEAKQKLNELKKMRALISYQQSKFRRVRKIKSKKFRRLVRKERQKQEEKQMEKMAVEKPDQFLERLDQLERRRIEERSTLRHKNSTKWAKEKKLLAKYNTDVREEIEEQLKLGKQLGMKTAPRDSDDESEKDEPQTKTIIPTKKSTEIPLILAPSHAEADANPWLTSPVLPTSEFAKPAEVQNNDESSSSESEEETTSTEKKQEDQVIPTDETHVVTIRQQQEHLNMPMTTKRTEEKPVIIQDDEKHRMNIQEAFADDDVLAEFEKEKTDITERDRPKQVDLSLPGWGDWAGAGIVTNKRKKRKFLVKPSLAPPRRDVHLHHVIINEQVDKKIGAHRVSELPFPFANVEQFESLIRQPLGREWNPETAFRRLNQPKVRTRIGTRIEPLNKQETFLKQSRHKQQLQMNLQGDNNLKQHEQTSTIEHDSLFDNEHSHQKNTKRKKNSNSIKKKV